MTIFDIPNQAECYCNVKRFTLGHSVLDLQAYNPIQQIRYELTFVDAVFFSCPVNWNSAEFEIDAPDECLAILRNIPRFDKIPDEYLLIRYKLYTVKRQRMPIQIICAGVPYAKAIED